MLKQAVLVAGVLGLAVAGAALTPFFAIQVLVGVVALLAVPFLITRAICAWPSLSLEDLRHLAFTALPVALAAVLTAFYLRMLIVMASLLTSEYETGLFVTSSRVLEMIGGLALLITGVILPVATVAARDDRPASATSWSTPRNWHSSPAACSRFVVVVAARPIVVLLGGQEFAAAAPVLRLQARSS